jgi:transposase
VGVDDFALRRNHHYGTLVVDLERHQLLDLWPERTAEPFAGWLHERMRLPAVICRYRGGAYADAARQAAPDALQVADRFHLAHNAGAVLERVLVRHARVVRAVTTRQSASEAPAEAYGITRRTANETISLVQSDVPASPSTGDGCQHHADSQSAAPCSRNTRRMRRLVRYQEVTALRRAGLSLTAIARQVGLSRPTVRKYVHADSFPEWPPRRTPLHAGSFYTAYLQERWAAGCHDASILWAELRAHGFTGSVRMVQRAVAGWRPAPRARGPRPC